MEPKLLILKKCYIMNISVMLSFLKNYHFIIRSEFIKIRSDHIKSFIYNSFMASSLTIFLVFMAMMMIASPET